MIISRSYLSTALLLICQSERSQAFQTWIGDFAQNRILQKSILSLSTVAKSETQDVDKNTIDSTISEPKVVKHALLISSFGDGIEKSPDAKQYLKSRIVSVMVSKYLRMKERLVEDSVKFSPCCGPDLDILAELEKSDQSFLDETKSSDELLQKLILATQTNEEESDSSSLSSSSSSSALEIRLLYIPTAMYALRSDSTSTPGKQRQRARADGKKRRTAIINQLQELFEDVNILGVTLDLDDGSIKQPTGSNDSSKFPKYGVEAFQSWEPHMIYIEGGNTFWLQYCIEKGDWKSLLINACTGDDAALYCGKSAGAIVAGQLVETATWKGWDDPSVVEGRESYQDWEGTKGLNFIGNKSIFPHMDDNWEKLVKEKKSNDRFRNVLPLRDSQVLGIDGDTDSTFLFEGDL